MFRGCLVPLNSFSQPIFVDLLLDYFTKPRNDLKTTTNLISIHTSYFLIKTQHQEILVDFFKSFELFIEQTLEIG